MSEGAAGAIGVLAGGMAVLLGVLALAARASSHNAGSHGAALEPGLSDAGLAVAGSPIRHSYATGKGKRMPEVENAGLPLVGGRLLHSIIGAAVLDCLHYLGVENGKALQSWALERGLSLELAAFRPDWERYIRPDRPPEFRP